MNTKSILRKCISILLCIAMMFCMVPASFAATTKTSAKKLPLATLSDLHYYPSTLAGSKGESYYTYMEGSNAQPDDVNQIVNATLESLKTEQTKTGLKYVVLCGDLTVNGEYEGHRVLANKLKKFEQETGLKVFVINGNHDINNSNGADFTTNIKKPAKTTSAADFYKLYKELGFTDAYHSYKKFGDGTQGSLTYSVKLDEGYRLIMVDGGKYSADSTEKGIAEHETAGAFTEEQLKWVLDEIDDAKANKEIPLLFSHWNMSSMNSFHDPLLQGFVVDDAYKLQDTIADAGCHYAFSGHQHQSDVNITYSDKGEAMYSIITPALTQFPFAYRMTTFTPKTDGSLDVKFEQKECDEYVPVKSSSGTYPSPYRTIGAAKQYGGNATASGYIMQLLKGFLSEYLYEIRAEGSIVKFVEKKMGISIEDTINGLLKDANKITELNLQPGKNVMAFLDDLDVQLMDKYIYDLPYLYSVLQNALDKLFDTQISNVPCTKYINEYGFGDKTKGGSLGDFVLDIMVTMYRGNENFSDDAFFMDILKRCGKVEFIDKLLDAIVECVIQDVVIDEVFKNTDIHFDALFLSTKDNIGGYIQLFYNLVLAIAGTGVFNEKSPAKFADAVSSLLTDWSNVSVKKLIDTVLATGLVNYGTNVKEIANSILASIIGTNGKKAVAYQLYDIVNGIASDDDKDFDVTYKYTGPVKITPTKEAMQIPSNIQISIADDASTSFTVTWFTKYSVTAHDIEVVKSGKAFTGKATTTNVTHKTTKETFTGYGFDLGTTGILPWSKEVNKHVVTVKGLTPGTKYKFRIGDFKKGFTCDGTYTTAATDEREFTFINLTDTDGVCPADYKNISYAMKAARNLYGDISFAVHSGNIVKNTINDMQWTWALDGNLSATKIPLMYTAGSHDADESYAAVKHFTQPESTCKYSECGTYYSFDYQDVHVAVLNTNYLENNGALSNAQYKWLYKDLQSNECTWTVISLYSDIATDAKKAEALKTQLIEIMNKFNVDLILQGGGNVYVRTKLLKNDKVVSNVDTKDIKFNGKTYPTYLTNDGNVTVISGCMNNEYAIKAPIDFRFASSVNTDKASFSAVTIEGDTLIFSAYTVDSKGNTELIDKFGMQKSNMKIKTGDVDLDGKITPADSRLALRMSIGMDVPTRFQALAADVDGVNGIETSDARKILRVAVGYEKFPMQYVSTTN